MIIERHSLISGARKAHGSVVIIDVFRAFTTAAYVMANGAERIISVGSLPEAFALKRSNPNWVLMGERDGKRVDGFDFGNSPFEIKEIDFSRKTVIQTTSAGTQGIANAKAAVEILPGSFVLAGAIIKHIQKTQPEAVSLVAMGSAGVEPSEEDELCAIYIEEALKGRTSDFDEMKLRIRRAPSGSKFFDPSQPHFHEEDFQMALDLDRFDFILKVMKTDRIYVIREKP